MKKTLVLIFALAVSFPLSADNDQPIDTERLPAPAREFIAQHFKDIGISLTTVDREIFETTYEVFFANGCKVEFDGKGHWKDIDCQHTRVPEGAVPEDIRRYVDTNYPGRYVTEIDRDTRDYEIKLDNQLELTFNLRFQLIGIDD